MNVVYTLMIIFGVIAFGSLLMWVASLFEPIYVPIFLVSLILFIGFATGIGIHVEENTTYQTEVVEMKIEEFYVTDENIYVYFENGYLIEVSLEEFRSLKQKDTAPVEIETKTDPFNGTTETARLFYGD